MPNGVYKIEKGDEVMTLVPAEARQLAPMLAGKALEASALARVQGDGGTDGGDAAATQVDGSSLQSAEGIEIGESGAAES